MVVWDFQTQGEVPLKLYRTNHGPYVEQDGRAYRVTGHTWDELVTSHDLHGRLASVVEQGEQATDFESAQILAPVERMRVGEAFTIVFIRRSGLSYSSNRRQEMWLGIWAGCGFAETLIGQYRSRS